MKVLQIASGNFFSTYGGGQVYVKNIVDTMIDAGIDVSIISFIQNVNTQKKDYKNHTLFEVPISITEAGIEKIFKEIKPDVIHVHSNEHIICRLGNKLNIPVVVTSHHGGILCPAGARLDCKDNICHRQISHTNCLPCYLRTIRMGLKLWYPFMKHIPQKAYVSLGNKLSNLPFIPFISPIGSAAKHIENHINNWHEICRKANIMIAPCNEIARAMIENGLDKTKVRVIPHGVPLPDKKPDFPPIIDGKIKLYYVGRICHVKGIHILLDAFSKVINPAIELHMIGGAGNKIEEKYMSGLKNKYQKDKRIIWHGKLSPSQVYTETSNFHVSVTASIFLEAFGLNIAESLALGKPVLASQCGGAEMQIKDRVNGWLVKPNDADALAKKIIELCSKPDILKQLSENCHAISLEKHCNRLVNIYNELI